MVELIRGKQRSYIPDKTSAIKTQQQAQIFQDIGSAFGDVAKVIKKFDDTDKQEKAKKEAQKRAASDISAHGKEAESIVLDARNEYGENISSEKGQQAIRSRLGEHFKKYRADYPDSFTGAEYDTLADKYINDTIDSNYLFATQAKINRQNAERKAAEKAAAQNTARQAKNAQDISDMYIAQAGELGKYGANTDLSALVKDMDSTLDKSIKNVPQATKDVAKAAGREAAVRNYVINAATSEDEGVAKQMDLALQNQEEFDKIFPAEYTAPIVAQAKDVALRNMNIERADLVREQTDTDEKSPRGKELKKKIKEIDKKIEKLDEDNIIEVDGEKKNFDDVIKNQVRETIAKDVEPIVRQRLGEQALVARREAQQQQKEDAALGATDIFDPSFKLDLIRLANIEAAGEQPQMSFIDDQKPKGFWQEFRDNYLGYVDNMSHVSPLSYTDIDVQGNVNAMIKQLTYEQLESPIGDPSEFEYKCFKTLFDISKLEMSQEDRVNAQNAVAKLMLSEDAAVNEFRALLESGEVGVTPVLRESSSLMISGLASDQPALDAFDKRMLDAQHKYQTLAVTMWANGATYDQIMNEKNRIFKDEINGFYREFHMVNLPELDEKLRNHESAYAKFNGITLEYLGRSPDQRPIWLDHAVLNTNRDLSRFLERKPMKDTNKRENNE